MQSDDALIDLLDENGNVIEQRVRSKIDKKVAILRSVNILLLNEKNELFVVEAKEKQPFDVQWGNSAAGLVRHGETREEAAKRTVARELGLKLDLVFLKEEFYNFNGVKRFMSTFYARTDQVPKINAEDIKKADWLSGEEIEKRKAQSMPTFLASLNIVASQL